jgi:hypothetical protein
MRRDTAPDWPIVIEQIVATGLTHEEIARRANQSLKGMRLLCDGMRQPLFYRGDALIVVWCEMTGKTRNDIPRREVVRGHRKARGPADLSPKLQSLPAWPPVQRVDMQGKKRRKKEIA